MESTTPQRLVRLEKAVFDEAQRQRKQLAPVLKFKTLSAFIMYVLGAGKEATGALELTPERMMMLELRNDVYAKLDKIQELLMSQTAPKTVTVTVDQLIGELHVPAPQKSVSDQVAKAIGAALRDARQSFN